MGGGVGAIVKFDIFITLNHFAKKISRKPQSEN